jgi:diaminohydroxyphosphoribosylaminopyrimidine deaminase / 5-amino-6-(5-phosphoribosylamino)uracil reductase
LKCLLHWIFVLKPRRLCRSSSGRGEIPHRQGVECIEVALNKDHELDLYEVLKVLAAKEISSVLVEGGHTLLNAFFSANLVNEVQTYIAPVIIGELEQKVSLHIKENSFFEEDYYCMAEMG